MIIKPSDFLQSDKRFKRWGKIVEAKDINLDKSNGFSIEGGIWVKWEESITLKEGQYLICAAEIGSMKYHNYNYKLINSEGEIVNFDSTQFKNVNETFLAKAKNSTLYEIGLYVVTISQNFKCPELKLANAFSLQMLEDVNCTVKIQETPIPDLSKYKSYIGHQDTANVLGVKMNRENLILKKGDELLVAQLIGGRLPEGATVLPEGFIFKFIKVTIL